MRRVDCWRCGRSRPLIATWAFTHTNREQQNITPQQQQGCGTRGLCQFNNTCVFATGGTIGGTTMRLCGRICPYLNSLLALLVGEKKTKTN